MRKVKFLKEKISFLFLVFFLPISISFAIDEDSQNMQVNQFMDKLINYFHSYYNQILKESIIKSKQQVFRELSQIVRESQITVDERMFKREDERFAILVDVINAYLESDKKSINLFTVDDSDVVNCWLGDLIEEKIIVRSVWNKAIKFRVKVIDNLIIHDFINLSTQGSEAIDVGVRGDTVYYNLDAYKARAKEIWDLLARRTKGKDKRYDPLKSNRLRKRLYIRNWGNLFLNTIDENKDLEKAKKSFVAKVVNQLQENNLFHEVGHIYARECLAIDEEVEEEIVAFLTELRYGILPYESLDVIISSRWRSLMESYNLASDRILTSFLCYIQLEQQKKNPDFKRIVIKDTRAKYSIDNLYKLNEEQIRTISEYIYKERYSSSDNDVLAHNKRNF
jgi:hypothetical protein